MEDITAYREAIMQCMMARIAQQPSPITEKAVRQRLAQLSDEELADGIDFNTPDEVAELLLED